MSTDLVPLFQQPFDSDGAAAADSRRPLIINDADLPAAAAELARRLGGRGDLFRRGGVLVRVFATADGVAVEPLKIDAIVIAAHEVCLPVVMKEIAGAPVLAPRTLPDRVARLMLNMPDKLPVPRLDGICAAPLLFADGQIRVTAGYDEKTRYWCVGVTLPPVPERPTDEQAAAALAMLRATFATFPFADREAGGPGRPDVIDLSRPPGLDESSFLTAILTAVVRPSLRFAPAILLRAPKFSGAGSGKGRLARALGAIAYGVSPRALAAGGDQIELDKRLNAALLAPTPMVLLDNLNATRLSSHLLSQVTTEEECGGRPLGTSNLRPLTKNALIVVTGNNVALVEDLTRRFLVVELDPRCEHPENRRFVGNFLEQVEQRRGALLAAALTIWRWGRQRELKNGIPIGSFEQWSSWVRDPLIALGCQDPIRRNAEMKRDDPQRRNIVEFLTQWRRLYGDRPIKASTIDADLLKIADLTGRSRQAAANFLANHADVRIAGLQLVRIRHGHWGAADYAVRATGEASGQAD